MPPKLKIICSDKPKLKQGEIRNKKPGDCFKRGLKAGFVAGINKALKKQAKIKPILQELKDKPPALKSTKPSLTTLIENRPNKATRVRDFLTTLPIKNKDLQISTKKKKELSTEGLKKYLIDTGEYRR